MIEVQQQVKSKILAETREKLANDLITQAARIESLKHGNYAWINEFYGDSKGKAGFLEIFKNIVPRTSHESAISEAKWGGIPLLAAINSYFEDPYKKIDAGILLAREYYKILITSGVIHDHE